MNNHSPHHAAFYHEGLSDAASRLASIAFFGLLGTEYLPIGQPQSIIGADWPGFHGFGFVRQTLIVRLSGNRPKRSSAPNRTANGSAVNSTQTRIVATGASWYGANTDALPHRLASVDKIDVSIQSVGKNAPQDVRAVLFPARVYNPQSNTRSDYLNGLYWEGRLNASPALNVITPISLKRQTRPLQGDQCVIDGLPLFAPDEPDLRPTSTSTEPWLYARLTVTYRDVNTTYCVVYDAEAIQQGRDFERPWRHVEEPKVVAKSLQQLTDETRRTGGTQS